MVNICLTFDNNYVKYVLTLCNSINIHNKKVYFHFIINNVDSETQYYLAKKLNDQCQFYHNIPDIDPNKMYEGKRLNSYAIYNTLYIATLLKDIDRVLYLDVDSLVISDLSDIYNINTGVKGIAAVMDYGNNDLFELINNQGKMAIPFIKQGKEVFNNSVMVMDLKKLRENNADEIMQYIARKFITSDMVAQNVYANGEWERLDRKWCVSANHVKLKLFKGIMQKDFKILTWHGEHKPWNTGHMRRHWENYECY